MQIAMAVRLRKEIEGEWLLGFAGLVSILFGTFVVIFPGSGALALVWLIALHAIVVGAPCWLWRCSCARCERPHPFRRDGGPAAWVLSSESWLSPS